MEKNGCLQNLAGGTLGCGGCLLQVAIVLAISCLLASWLCDINPEKTYTWYSGIWHGLWFFPNLVRSFFSDSIFKAQSYTTAYNVWWWITVIFQGLSILGGGSSSRRY